MSDENNIYLIFSLIMLIIAAVFVVKRINISKTNNEVPFFYKKELHYTLINKHPFLFCSCIMSFLIGIWFCLQFFFYDFPYNLYGICFLIPVLFMFFCCYIFVKNFHKAPNMIRVVSFVLNIAILFFVQVYLSFAIVFSFAGQLEQTFYDNPNDYQKAMSKIRNSIGIIHFPTRIPDDAQNVIFKMETNHFFGSTEVLLMYSVSDDYIKEKKQVYENMKIPVIAFDIYENLPVFKSNAIDINGFKIYLFGNRDKDNTRNRDSYAYGVGINEQKHQIMYFYSNPD